MFTGIYEALKQKGVDFSSAPNSQPNYIPGYSQSSQAMNRELNKKGLSSQGDKNINTLSTKHQTIVEQMNLLKGNINFTNELIDNSKTRQELRDNETLIELMKTLKGMEEKLINLIQDTENEDVLKICIMVNEDMHFTFDRFRAIKDGMKALEFVPGECKQVMHYLNPTHIYQRQFSSFEGAQDR